jgi:hypothetical protein
MLEATMAIDEEMVNQEQEDKAFLEAVLPDATYLSTKKPSTSRIIIPIGGTQGRQKDKRGYLGGGQDDQHHGGAGQVDQCQG